MRVTVTKERRLFKMATKKTAPKSAVKEKPAGKKTRAVKPKDVAAGTPKKEPAQCVFDFFNLKFGMTKEEVSNVLDFAESGHINEEANLKIGSEMVELFFDHMDRLWQVKARYRIKDFPEAEALLDRMSKDYRLQTPTSRVAFETMEDDEGHTTLYIRYSEINLKRMYLHHMMALGAVKLAEEEKIKKSLEEAEQEEYIPTGPLMF